MEWIRAQDKVYAEDENGGLLAEITFPVIDGEAVINHTFVDESLRGKGIASQLMKEAVAVIKSRGLKAQPVCSYAVAWFEKHPEEQGLLAE